MVYRDCSCLSGSVLLTLGMQEVVLLILQIWHSLSRKCDRVPFIVQQSPSMSRLISTRSSFSDKSFRSSHSVAVICEK